MIEIKQLSKSGLNQTKHFISQEIILNMELQYLVVLGAVNLTKKLDANGKIHGKKLSKINLSCSMERNMVKTKNG